jgi:hypothetical protein
MLRRWMLFVDGENLTLRGQKFATKNNLTLKLERGLFSLDAESAST